jgi:hypothetical protein
MLLVSGCIAAHQRRASQVAMNGPMPSSGAISQTRHQTSGWSWKESAAADVKWVILLMSLPPRSGTMLPSVQHGARRYCARDRGEQIVDEPQGDEVQTVRD